MTDHHATHASHHEKPKDPSRWVVRILMIALLAVGAYYVIAEHGAHLLEAWPLLILLACPLMHLMHGGHGGHHVRGAGEEPRNG